MEANSNAKGVDESKLSSYQKTQLDDGVLYSKDGKQVEADKIIGDEYYDTTINDMWLNYDSYKGKKIQIEGMFLKNSGLTFVGRYSTSSLCANCPAGYSVMEYQLDGTIDQELINEKSWIKIVATLEKGNDEGSSMDACRPSRKAWCQVPHRYSKDRIEPFLSGDRPRLRQHHTS